MREAKPFIIGIWSGEGKPKCLTEFLGPLIDEINFVHHNRMIINGHEITVNIRCFICDTPARCHLKGMEIKTIKFIESS